MKARSLLRCALAAALYCAVGAFAQSLRCPAPDNSAIEKRPRLMDAIEHGNEAQAKKFLQEGDDPNACFGGASLFTHAAVEGHWPLAEVLLTAGAHVDEPRDAAGLTPLMRAVDEGRFDIGLKMLEAGADARATLEDGTNLLHYAALAQTEDAPRTLIEQLGLILALARAGAFINSQTPEGFTPVRIAAARGNLSAVAQLVSLGADVNIADRHGKTPLSLAHDNGRDDIALCVRRAGAKADVTGWVSLAQLVEARRHKDLAQALRTVPPEALSQWQRQALLTTAILSGDAEPIAALVEWGVDVNATSEFREGRDVWPQTPLLLALSPYGRRAPVVQALLEAGADPNGAGKPPIADVATPLLTAINADQYDLALLLLTAGALAMRADERSGQTPLMAAVLTADAEQATRSRLLLLRLLELGAQVDARDAHGLTALHMAAMAGNAVAVNVLLAHGASADALDETQHTPLHYARKVKAAPVVALLERSKK